MRKRRSLLQPDPGAPRSPDDSMPRDVIDTTEGKYASEGRPSDTTDIDWRQTPGPNSRRASAPPSPGFGLPAATPADKKPASMAPAPPPKDPTPTPTPTPKAAPEAP